jgi:CheY-like chemotaxis protein
MSDAEQKPKSEREEWGAVGQELKRRLAARRAADQPSKPSQAEARQSAQEQPAATGAESGVLVAASEEFRDSLQTIAGFLELLMEGKVPDARQAKQFLGIAYRESQFLSNRVKDLQTAATITSGKMRLKPGPIPMEAVFQSVLDAASEAATAKGLRIGAAPHEELPTIEGDDALLRQALTDLLDVAIRRTERDGELAVSASSDGTALKLRLTGINSGESRSLAQARGTVTDKSDDAVATGLAVYVADRIIREHEGSLLVEGPVGKAKAFTVVLPLKARLSKRGLILIVDDNPHAALLVEYAVQKEGFEAVKAINGLEALEKVKTHRFDLVLLDVLLPGMDGFEVCHRLRSAPETASVPIVMVSAKARDEDRATALRIGADAYLAKPLAMSQLMSTIETLLEDARSK